MSLRPYQVECLDDSVAAYEKDVTRQLWVLPTGSGKGTLIAHIPEWFGLLGWDSVMFVVHREELIVQTAERFARYNPGLKIEIEKAEKRADPDSHVIVGSVQSLGTTKFDLGGIFDYPQRLRKFDPSSIKVVVIDEAHRSTSPLYQSILQYFGLQKHQANRDKKILIGCTATPERTDGIGLETVFEQITYDISLPTMIKDGWLMDPECWRVQTYVDISSIKVQAGDLSVKDMSNKLDTPERNKLIVKKYMELGHGLPAFAFTVDIKHSENLALMFRENGIAAEAISGKTKNRGELLSMFGRLAIQVLCSCEVLSEGVDQPKASVALMGRPTKSGLKCKQQIGRVLRPYPSPEDMAEHERNGTEPDWIKPRAIVIDFSDLSGRHSLINTPTLFGLSSKFDMGGQKAQKTVEQIEALLKPGFKLTDFDSVKDAKSKVDRADLMKPPTVRADVKRLSRLLWLEVFTDRLQLSLKGGFLEITKNLLGQYELYQSNNGYRILRDTKANLAEALHAGDALVPKQEIGGLMANAAWRKHPPTEKACHYLWSLNKKMREYGDTKDKFFKYALAQHEAGNMMFSKGAIGAMISKGFISKGGPRK